MRGLVIHESCVRSGAMCGRLAMMTMSWADISHLWTAGSPEFEQAEAFAAAQAPRYNVAPSQPLLAIRRHAEASAPEFVKLPWGMRAGTGGSLLINARSESLTSRPTFASAFQARRCIIPANGFFEWEVLGSQKLPYFVEVTDQSMFCFAALWGTSMTRDGELVESCAIITTEANDRLAPLHERMPVILSAETLGTWLDPETDPRLLRALLKPYPSNLMSTRRVDAVVNDARVDTPECVSAPSPVHEAQEAERRGLQDSSEQMNLFG